MSMKMILRLLLMFVAITSVVPQPNEDMKPKIEHLSKINVAPGTTNITSKLNVTEKVVKQRKYVLSKCCPIGEAFVNYSLCYNSNDSFNPHVYEEAAIRQFRKIETINIIDEFDITIVDNVTNVCGNTSKPLLQDKFKILKNGSLLIVLDNDVQLYAPDKYCVDNFVSQESGDENLVELNALVCFVNKEAKFNYVLNSTCMLVSCFFIILTVGVYAWLPELRNLHGMVLMAYLLSFFVGFTFLSAMQILLEWHTITSTTCTGLTFIIYYGLLAAFFWMNVMCYDIWWTFSGNRSLSDRKFSMRGRFLGYSLYAFGVPTALTVLLAVLEFAVDPGLSNFLPHIGTRGCFLYGTNKLIYFYTPIVALCLSNLVFFTLTAIKIAEIKRQTLVLNQKDKQRFSLYIKLFILMGVNWILEVISSFYPDHDNIWKFTDAYNVLVGLIIFIIFVCKKKTLEKIKHRYKHLMGHPISRTQTKSTGASNRTTSKDETVPVAEPNSSIKK